jgi:ATP-binding cassette subfamily B protein/subfamily B ATP-binding cassette protein MsbA
MRRYVPLLRYARPHLREIAIIIGAMLIGIGLSVVQPWPLKILIDSVLGEKAVPAGVDRWVDRVPGSSYPKRLLFLVVLGTLAIALLGSLVSYVQTMATVRFNQRVTYDLGADLFEHLQRLSVRYFGKHSLGDSIARVTLDPYCIQILVTGALLPVLQSITSLVIMFAIMWRIEPTLTLVSLSVVPLQILTIRLLAGPMKRRVRLRRDLEAQMMSRVEQVLSTLPTVQAFGRERFEVANFRRDSRATADAYVSATRTELSFSELTKFVTVVGTAIILLLGGNYAIDGRMSAGAILVFISYLNSLYAPLNAITYSAATIQTAAANADRVLEVLDAAPDVDESPQAYARPLRGRIAFEDVSFAYEPGRPVLEHVSFTAEPGEVVAIVGSSGAGKTSLVNLLPRFLDPASGRIVIDGYDVRDLTVESLRAQIAMVMQEPQLMPLSIAENIRYGRQNATLAEVHAAAKRARANTFIEALPAMYETVIGERGIGLSGGERQRIAIARAFLRDAPILILDEPTSALDARTESALLESLEQLMHNRTAIVIAHRLSTIRNANRIVVLEQGRVAEVGTHAELIHQNGPYARMYFRQMRMANHERTEAIDESITPGVE